MEICKYIFLAIFIISLVLINTSYGYPLFCKFVCIVEVLEAKIPFLILKPQMLSYEGLFFYIKLFLLISVVLLSTMVFRPFCRFFCPLGAVYSLFNPISLMRLKVDHRKWVNCGLCKKVCKLDIEVHTKPNSMECIRCGQCIAACPRNAINVDTRWGKSKEQKYLQHS